MVDVGTKLRRIRFPKLMAFASARGTNHDGHDLDASILRAPTSTKNRGQQRDPEMHQTKKGKQAVSPRCILQFGMQGKVCSI